MNIKASPIELAKLNNTLTKKGGPEKNGHLFEKAMNLEDEILNTNTAPLMRVEKD